MKRWRYALLVWELFLFALILVLPQVDLPDFTFPGGTAPIVAKARLSSPPTFSIVPAPIQARPSGYTRKREPLGIWLAVQLDILSPLMLDCALRC